MTKWLSVGLQTKLLRVSSNPVAVTETLVCIFYWISGNI